MKKHFYSTGLCFCVVFYLCCQPNQVYVFWKTDTLEIAVPDDFKVIKNTNEELRDEGDGMGMYMYLFRAKTITVKKWTQQWLMQLAMEMHK